MIEVMNEWMNEKGREEGQFNKDLIVNEKLPIRETMKS